MADLSLDDLIIETRPTQGSPRDLVTWMVAAADLVERTGRTHTALPAPMPLTELRELLFGLVLVAKSSRAALAAIVRDGAHWAGLPAGTPGALLWNGATPQEFELPAVPAAQLRGKLLDAVGEWFQSAEGDLDLTENTLLRVVALLSVFDQPAADQDGERR